MGTDPYLPVGQSLDEHWRGRPAYLVDYYSDVTRQAVWAGLVNLSYGCARAAAHWARVAWPDPDPGESGFELL